METNLQECLYIYYDILSDNDLEKKFNFRKNIGKCCKCQWGCHDNVIRNADHYKTLKKWEMKNGWPLFKL